MGKQRTANSEPTERGTSNAECGTGEVPAPSAVPSSALPLPRSKKRIPLSPATQTIARLDRIFATLDAVTRDRVLKWVRDIPLASEVPPTKAE
jgi:hypothetical protein